MDEITRGRYVTVFPTLGAKKRGQVLLGEKNMVVLLLFVLIPHLARHETAAEGIQLPRHIEPPAGVLQGQRVDQPPAALDNRRWNASCTAPHGRKNTHKSIIRIDFTRAPSLRNSFLLTNSSNSQTNARQVGKFEAKAKLVGDAKMR